MTQARHSAIYVGTVRHRRRGQVVHRFQSRLFLLYLDLDELPAVLDGSWLWSARRPAPLWFRRADYLGDARVPLADAVRQRVAQHTGTAPSGPIRMLTHLRTCGYCFNPVTFYYCFAQDGGLEAVVAEITNTPWRERRAYVLRPPPGTGRRAVHRFQLDKDFHVSPFLPMDLHYDWRFSLPGERLAVHMALHRGAPVFDATLSLHRRPLTARSLALALLRYPLMPLRVIARIHFEALRLWLKGAPVYSHPATAGGGRP